MKRIITLVFMFICFIGYAQLPDSIKHVEIASEIADTMILLNKTDVDKINTVFNRLEYADSLNEINEEIISTLNAENDKLGFIISEQDSIIINKNAQIKYIEDTNREVISRLEKQVKRANRGKIALGVIGGVSVAGLIFSLIFRK